MIERIPTASRAHWHGLRQADVTASVVGALLGEHEFVTPFGLWALKTGRVAPDDAETASMERGRLLEPVAVQLLRERHPDWRITHNAGAEQVYLRDASARLGATPDVFVETPSAGRGIVQVKSVEASVYRRKWVQHGEVTPPMWILAQAITEAHLAGADWAMVAPLVVGHGLDMPELPIPIHAGLIARIYREVARFWAMVDAGEEPPLDYHADAGIVDLLWPEDDGGEVELPARAAELVHQRTQAKAAIKAYEATIEPIDAELKQMLGNAARGRGPGFSISWKTQERAGFTVEPKTLRVFRVKEQAA